MGFGARLWGRAVGSAVVRVRWWVGMVVRFVCVTRVSVCPVCVPAPPGVTFSELWPANYMANFCVPPSPSSTKNSPPNLI